MKPNALLIVPFLALLSTISTPAAFSESSADDYLNTGGVIRKWSDERIPVTFYIYSGDGVPGFESRFIEMANNAFDDWTTATKGKVLFKRVDDPKQAYINLKWTNDPSKLPTNFSPSEMGATKILSDNKGNNQADIGILTKAPNAVVSFNDIALRWVLLHEVGHALGLLHSTKAEDIMFGGYSDQKETPKLSMRDQNTICKLYTDSVKNNVTGQELHKSDDPGVLEMWDQDNEKGLAAINQKDFAKAITIFTGLSKEHPTTTLYRDNWIAALEGAGNAAIAKGAIDSGIDYLEQALSLNTNLESSKVNVARGYSMKADVVLNSGHPDEAANYYKKALVLLPPRRKDIIDHDVHYCALILEQLGRKDEANKLRAKYPGQ
jgi:tetratricopeptide (TPR) repeat protein